jgi:hypothetical protein
MKEHERRFLRPENSEFSVTRDRMLAIWPHERGERSHGISICRLIVVNAPYTREGGVTLSEHACLERRPSTGIVLATTSRLEFCQAVAQRPVHEHPWAKLAQTASDVPTKTLIA